MAATRYLTKSRFKLATECPTKLFYTQKKIYPSTKLGDPFLEALADGGYQVGELAKCYYPAGIEVSAPNDAEAERQTQELLEAENVVIFEPAIRFENLFIRADILVKRGNTLQIIEVKAKSYSSEEDGDFIGKKHRKVPTDWKPYLYDVAFQKYVVCKAFPNYAVSSSLMLVDKNAKAATSGLNQKFRVQRSESRKNVAVISDGLNELEIENRLLITVPTDDALEVIYNTELTEDFPEDSFIRNIKALADGFEKDQRIPSAIGTKCKTCEFRCTTEQERLGLRNGFKECWTAQLGWQGNDFDEPTVLDIKGNFGAKNYIKSGKIKLSQVESPYPSVIEASGTPLQAKERLWLQVEKAQNSDSTIYFDAKGIEREMASWTYPLHFIDFETNAMAIPFYRGMRPYEGIAFQFSHHQVESDGKVSHVGEYLNTNRGEFPNFDFVRELKSQLENDDGTIFRYSTHENTYLNVIYQQLKASSEADKLELMNFIQLITKSTGKSDEDWVGARSMIDLCNLVKSYYYDPATKGSNSMKFVLPAILGSAAYLRDKYQHPVYGTADIPSRNFRDQIWVAFDDQGRLIDPYKLLPRVFDGISEHDVELLSQTDELNNGGLALTAYGLMQFCEMSALERTALNAALLKYCELDTLGMVMIYEAWVDWIKNGLDQL